MAAEELVVVDLAKNTHVNMVEVVDLTGSRGPAGPPGQDADLSEHESATDPHAAAKYGVVSQLGSAAGRKIFVQLSGDAEPTGMVDGDILIREV